MLGSELQNMSFLSGVKGSLADLDGGVACIVLSWVVTDIRKGAQVVSKMGTAYENIMLTCWLLGEDGEAIIVAKFGTIAYNGQP